MHGSAGAPLPRHIQSSSKLPARMTGINGGCHMSPYLSRTVMGAFALCLSTLAAKADPHMGHPLLADQHAPAGAGKTTVHEGDFGAHAIERGHDAVLCGRA